MDLFAYPVSLVMKFWHWVLGFVVDPDSGAAWVGSVILLVVTVRLILMRSMWRQQYSMRKMAQLAPKMKELQKRYKNDREKLAVETRKLQKQEGFNPLLGCLPMLIQIPVFLGLFHVLRSFNRMGTGMGQLGMSAAETRSQGNYVFSAEQVQNFLDARLFGVPLSSYLVEPATEFQAFVEPGSPIDFTRPQIAFVVIPMMIVASIATHLNSRASVARQPEAALENPQTRMMNNLALYIFPLGILVSGIFFPVAILLYWMSNNVWTYGQQHVVFGRIERREEEEREQQK